MFTNILTMDQVLPWIPSQSCLHMGTCAKGSLGARAHKAMLYQKVTEGPYQDRPPLCPFRQ